MSHESIDELLSRVDPSRMYSGCPVGLRDGAVLALLAVDLTPREVARLRTSAVFMNRGKLLVTVRRKRGTWCVALPADLGGRVLAWLTERRSWSEGVPVFPGEREAISVASIYAILQRYRRPRRKRRC